MTYLRRHAGLFAVLAAILAVALSFDVVDAASPSGPVPATTNTVTLSASPVTGLTDGQTITYSVTTSGSTTLTGAVTAHLCKHGLTGYSTSNFGYSGSQGVRCVYQAGIVSGGLTDADYEAAQNFFQAATTGALTFKAGTGSLVWGSVTGQGPLSIQCDSSNPCDLVVQVNLTGDSVATTYFIQPLEYGGGGGPTTTTSSTTTSSTSSTSSTSTSSTSSTSTSSTSTSSTTSSTTTSTTKPPTTTTSTTTSTTVPVTTTTIAGTGGGTVTPAIATPSGVVTVVSDGWKTGSSVAATLHSTPVSLGTLTATADGTVNGQFTLPSDTAIGAHTIELTGTDPEDAARTVTLNLTVVTSTAVTTLPVGGTGGSVTGNSAGTTLAFTGSSPRNIVSVALLLLAVGLLVLGQQQRRRSVRS
ncbi:MAG TPA: hypothetical protein VGN51_07915 [Acidimicrobiia bacterium]|jgi:hypothetical protein